MNKSTVDLPEVNCWSTYSSVNITSPILYKVLITIQLIHIDKPCEYISITCTVYKLWPIIHISNWEQLSPFSVSSKLKMCSNH